MGMFAPNQHFDIRQSSALSNGVCLKQFNFENRGIKTFCVHKGHLVIATYQKVQSVNAPAEYVIAQGFKPSLKNMADDYRYALEVYKLPSYYANQDTKKHNWKEISYLQKLLYSFAGKFKDDELVSSMQSLTLDIQNAAMVNAMGQDPPIGAQEEFLFVSTIKLEKKCEKIQYPSNLYIFQINENGLQLMGKHSMKRMVGCMSAYRGRLLTVQ